MLHPEMAEDRQSFSAWLACIQLSQQVQFILSQVSLILEIQAVWAPLFLSDFAHSDVEFTSKSQPICVPALCVQLLVVLDEDCLFCSTAHRSTDGINNCCSALLACLFEEFKHITRTWKAFE